MGIFFKRWKARLIYEYLEKHDGERITKREIALNTGLGQDTVVEELRKFKATGFVKEEGGKYYLTRPSEI